jgi:hypothetical protein
MLQLSTIRITCAVAAKSRAGVLVAQVDLQELMA